MRAVINDAKKGKSYSKVINDSDAKRLYGKRIGEVIKGEALDLQGYELLITGGSDLQGFPMKKSVLGSKRKKLLLSKGLGFRTKIKGLKKRRTVRGNALDKDIGQVNMKVVKQGKQPLDKIFKKEEKTGKKSKGEK